MHDPRTAIADLIALNLCGSHGVLLAGGPQGLTIDTDATWPRMEDWLYDEGIGEHVRDLPSGWACIGRRLGDPATVQLAIAIDTITRTMLAAAAGLTPSADLDTVNAWLRESQDTEHDPHGDLADAWDDVRSRITGGGDYDIASML